MSEAWVHECVYSGVHMRYQRIVENEGMTLEFQRGVLKGRMFITDADLIRDKNEGLTFQRMFEVFCPESLKESTE